MFDGECQLIITERFELIDQHGLSCGSQIEVDLLVSFTLESFTHFMSQNQQRRKRSADVHQPSVLIQKKWKPAQVNSADSVAVTFQRIPTGAVFEGELSKFYNPTYFFLRISNQMASYDLMRREIKFDASMIFVSDLINPLPDVFQCSLQ